jgi:hypothetical protein
MFRVFIFLFLIAFALNAQTYQALAEKYAQLHFKTYQSFLSIPSDAHFSEDLEKNKFGSVRNLPTEALP